MELCFPMINLASQIQSLETGRGLREEMNVRAIMEAKSTSGACLAVGSNGQRKVRNRGCRGFVAGAIGMVKSLTKIKNKGDE